MSRLNGWPRHRIDHLGTVQGGRQRSHRITAGRLRPYLRVANVFDGFIDSNDLLRMPFTDEEFSRFQLFPRDILINEGQSLDLVGRSAVYEGEPPECAFQNTLLRFRPGEGTDVRFAQALFKHLHQTGVFSTIASRTTSIAHLGASRFAAVKVPFPPLAIQRRIGEIAAAWQSMEWTLKELSEAKRRLKRGLLLQLLRGRRSRSGFYDPWRVARLSSVLSESRDTASTGERAQRLSIKLYARGAEPNVDARPGSARTQYYRRRTGQLVYSKLDFLNGAVAILPPELDGYESTLDLPAFDISQEANGSYLWRLFSSPDFYRRQVRIAHGGRKARRVNPRHLLALEVSLPSRREQDAICACLDCLDRDIRLVTNQRDLLAMQRSAIMDRLLTGKLRLTV